MSGLRESPKVYVADFVVFGRRERRSRKPYPYAYAALRSPDDREWVTGYIVGFASSHELAEAQVNMRKRQGWTGPFEIVETRETDE